MGYEVRGEGPFFIYDHKTDKCVSMVSFRTRPEAEAFIDMLNRGKAKDDDDKANT